MPEKIGRWDYFLGASSDWPKTTFDFESDNAEDARAEIEGLGWTVADFKTKQAYRAALASGEYPWLKEL